MRRMYILSVLLCFFLIRLTAHACTCARGDPPFDFNNAKAVFIGQMLGGTEELSAQDQNGESHAIEAGRVRFAVEEVFKGGISGEITIEIASMKGTSCGPYGLKRGERYIVYSYGSDKDVEILYSGVCTRTKPVDSKYAKEDLDFLRTLPRAGTGGNLKRIVLNDNLKNTNVVLSLKGLAGGCEK